MGNRNSYVGQPFLDTFAVFAPGATGGKISGFTAANFQQFEFFNGEGVGFTPTIYEATGTGQYFMSQPTGFPTPGYYVVQVVDPVGEIWESEIVVASGPLAFTLLQTSATGPTGSVGYALSGMAFNPGLPQQSAQVSFTYNSSLSQLVGNAWVTVNGQQATTVTTAVVSVYNSSGVLQGTVTVPTPDANGVFGFVIPNLTFSINQLLYVQAHITMASGALVASVKGLQVL